MLFGVMDDRDLYMDDASILELSYLRLGCIDLHPVGIDQPISITDPFLSVKQIYLERIHLPLNGVEDLTIVIATCSVSLSKCL